MEPARRFVAVSLASESILLHSLGKTCILYSLKYIQLDRGIHLNDIQF